MPWRINSHRHIVIDRDGSCRSISSRRAKRIEPANEPETTPHKFHGEGAMVPLPRNRSFGRTCSAAPID
jgi:hypothetical protein